MPRRALLAAVAILYVLSVPWYRAADAAPPLLLGLPDWVAVALGCYVMCAALNAAAWLLTEVPDAPTPADQRFAASVRASAASAHAPTDRTRGGGGDAGPGAPRAQDRP